MVRKLLAVIITLALVVLGFFFLTVAIVIGAVLALIIGLRLWWTMRKLKRQGIIIDPAREREHSGAGGAGAIDGEYQVVEREGAPRLPSEPR